jgi:hypothetical protein
MSKRMTKADLPTSLGAFKPVGHVMVAVPDDATADRMAHALHEVGFEAEDVLHFAPHESGSEMAKMIDNSSEFAGFGYEITLMRRYLDYARQGYSWMLVYAPEDEQAEKVKETAEKIGAPMAVRYHRLAVEDLV